tara:strand:+ start:616 stop:717 length:102 start_codon:yes stop_codon:yes gene_type:complete
MEYLDEILERIEREKEILEQWESVNTIQDKENL